MEQHPQTALILILILDRVHLPLYSLREPAEETSHYIYITTPAQSMSSPSLNIIRGYLHTDRNLLIQLESTGYSLADERIDRAMEHPLRSYRV